MFPSEIDTFVDVFCGGGNVGLNTTAKQVILNDRDLHVSLLLQVFRNYTYQDLLLEIMDIIHTHQLSMVSDNGYAYYNTNSTKGLADYNREPFLQLRKEFNQQQLDYNYYITLYVLIVYAFNNQIRFNSKGEFNLPVGKRDFNQKMQEKLRLFVHRIQKTQPLFTHNDFRSIDISAYKEKDFFYLDPPYFITCATYNE